MSRNFYNAVLQLPTINLTEAVRDCIAHNAYILWEVNVDSFREEMYTLCNNPTAIAFQKRVIGYVTKATGSHPDIE